MSAQEYSNLIAAGSPIKVGGIRNWKGTYLSTWDTDFAKQHASAVNLAGLGISRPILLAMLKQMLPQDAISTNSEFEHYESSEKNILVHLKSGQVHEFDVLVGADGIYSKVRSQLLPKSIYYYFVLIYYSYTIVFGFYIMESNLRISRE